ncbi:TIGR03943 family putative permease subunit [Fictibacillus iocasae]|uniref:TIGR03943 family putative permease subunit n=1 Tax=Fictibacillus iocasae TaxID=2715437 RepID=A0ABW2NM87_9BACL
MKEEQDWGFHTYIRGIILIGFMLLLVGLIANGKLGLFIAPKMKPFAYFAVIVLGLLGISQFFRSTKKGQEEEMACDCGIDHRPSGSSFKHFFVYLLFVIPILTGFILPEKAMDSSVAEKRGIQYGTGLYTKPTTVTEDGKTVPTQKVDVEEYLKDPEGYIAKIEENIAEENPIQYVDVHDYYKEFASILDNKDKVTVTSENFLDVMSVLELYLDRFIGKEMKTLGFVYREDNMPKDQIVIARFAMNCCSADSAVYGTIITGRNVHKWEKDTWYEISGTLDKTTFNNQKLPLLVVKDYKKVKEPKDPYVYPSAGSLGLN